MRNAVRSQRKALAAAALALTTAALLATSGAALGRPAGPSLPGRVLVTNRTGSMTFAGSRLVVGTVVGGCQRIQAYDLSGHRGLDISAGAPPGQVPCSGTDPVDVVAGDGQVGWSVRTIGNSETSGIYRAASLRTGSTHILKRYDIPGLGAGRASTGSTARTVAPFALVGDGAGLMAWGDWQGLHRVVGTEAVSFTHQHLVAAAADSGRVVALTDPETSLEVIAGRGRVLMTTPFDGSQSSPLVALRRDRLALVEKGQLRILSVPGGRVVHTLAVPTSTYLLAMSQGYVVYAAGGLGGEPYELQVVHLADERKTQVFKERDPVDAVALGSPGLAYTVSQHGEAIRLLSLAQLRRLAP